MKPTRCARKSETALSLRTPISCSPTKTVPDVGLSMQPTRLRSVVLPLPDGPTIMEKRCRGISRLIPLIAGTSTAPALYVLTTLERRTTGRVDGPDIKHASLSCDSVVQRERDRLVGFAVEIECGLIEFWRSAGRLGVVRESEAFGGHAERVGVQLAVAVLILIAGDGVPASREIVNHEKDIAFGGRRLLSHFGELRLAEVGFIIDDQVHRAGGVVDILDGNAEVGCACRGSGERQQRKSEGQGVETHHIFLLSMPAVWGLRCIWLNFTSSG